MENVLVAHRRAVVIAGIAVAVSEIAIGAVEPVSAYVACAVIGGPLVAAGIADRRRHNRHPPAAAFVVNVRDHSFRTPRLADVVHRALIYLQAFAALTTATESGTFQGPFLLWAAAATLLVGTLLSANSLIIWRGYGLTLRPDGITADKAWGSLVIPWAALASQRPGPGGDGETVKLAYARPELVTSTGLMPVRDEVVFEGVDGEFVASAIHVYATDRERRHAIGTAAEHELLRAVPRAPRGELRAEPMTPGRIMTRVAVGLGLLIGGVAGVIALSDRHQYLATLGTIGVVNGFDVLARTLSRWRAARRQARTAAYRRHEPPGRYAGRLVGRIWVSWRCGR